MTVPPPPQFGSWLEENREWVDPVHMPTPFDKLLEAIWIFDDSDRIIFQTAQGGWDHSHLRIVHRINQDQYLMNKDGLPNYDTRSCGKTMPYRSTHQD